MFRKLLKYDLRSMWKQFAFVWPAALALALLHRFSLPSIPSSVLEELGIGPGVYLSGTASNIVSLVYAAVLVAMFVLMMVFIIQRFYKGLLGDEGYLMHTLPVQPWQLISSKLVCALVVITISILVAIASLLLMSPIGPNFWKTLADSFREISGKYGASFYLLLLELAAASLLSMLQAFLHLYLAMAIGHLFSKHRVAFSVVAFVAIRAAISAVSTLFGSSAEVALTTVVLQASDAVQITGRYPDMGVFHDLLLPLMLLEIVLIVAFFIPTNYILKNKLNLE